MFMDEGGKGGIANGMDPKYRSLYGKKGRATGIGKSGSIRRITEKTLRDPGHLILELNVRLLKSWYPPACRRNGKDQGDKK